MPEPIYIVSGFPRSGTSMVMRALEAGGIPCAYSTDGDDNRNRNTLIPGYVPNPHGFYEGADLTEWPQHRGKAVKVVRDNLDMLPTGERLQIVYMLRDPAEIRQSYIGILSGPYSESVFGFLNDYEAKSEADVKSTGATALRYAAIVSDPIRELSKLGWPFDVRKAAATIDPSLYRHRRAA